GHGRDARSLLALHAAARERHGEFGYLAIGSHFGRFAAVVRRRSALPARRVDRPTPDEPARRPAGDGLLPR
ncbi:MAG: hypothetical protein LC798_21405, partial [Chloroflexi bacterium]|nr:hypothetical protein [Chloroflexota bacterium]